MSDGGDLIAEIGSLLGPSINPQLTTKDALSDLYEAYIFALLVRAAREEKAKTEFRSVTGVSVTDLVFRKSPGFLNSTRHPYTHARIDVDSNRGALEAHVGVRTAGKSGVLHECDVLIISHSEAERCRRLGLAPRSHALLLAVEAKFYTTALPLAEARGFVGLRSDLSAHDSAMVANVPAPESSRFLSARTGYHETELVPASGAVDRFVGRVRMALAYHRRR